MKPWQKALGDLRVLGPDIPPFRRAVKLVADRIEELERELRECRAIIAAIPGAGQEGC